MQPAEDHQVVMLLAGRPQDGVLRVPVQRAQSHRYSFGDAQPLDSLLEQRLARGAATRHQRQRRSDLLDDLGAELQY